jgi:hypothetical protein
VSAQDLEEWDAACAEYDELKELGVDPFNALDFASPEEYELFTELMHVIDEAIIGLGGVIDKNQPKGGRDLQSFLALYYAARAFHCVKLTKNILDRFPSRDAIGIVRTVYECILRARFAFSGNYAAETLIAQASSGSGHILQKIGVGGKVNRGWIVDKRSGKEFRAHTRFSDMAGSSGSKVDASIHEELYPFLCGVAHADLADFHMYFSPEEGFFAQRHKGRNPETPLLVVAISILLMAELSRVPGLTQRSRRDALFIARKHAALLGAFSARFPELSIFAGMPQLKARMDFLSKQKLKRRRVRSGSELTRERGCCHLAERLMSVLLEGRAPYSSGSVVKSSG